MNEVNAYIFQTLVNSAVFSGEMSNRIFPLFAPEKTAYPFSVYSIPGGVAQQTKDAKEFTVAVSLFYAANNYTECCAFTDKVIEIMESAQFRFQSVLAEYDDEYNAVVSTIILTITQS